MSSRWHSSNRRARLPRDWPKTHSRILGRDPVCTCHGCHACTAPGVRCLRLSTDVDHLVRGDNHDDTNLAGKCGPCHDVKSSSEGHAARPKLSRPAEPHPGLL